MSSLPSTRLEFSQLRIGKVVALVTSLGLLLALPQFLNTPYITTIFIAVLLFGIFGAIYDFMIGYAGLSNFGFAGFLAVGAYTSALGAVHYAINPWTGLLLGGVVTALVGFLTGWITLRQRGLYLGLMTWFVAEMIRFTISNTPEYTRGRLGLSVMPFPNIFGIEFARGGNALAYYYLLILLGVGIVFAMHLVVRSRIGLAFKAIREDQLAAESLGLSASGYKLLNFTIASFFTGVMGSFYAHYVGILSPSPEEFGVSRTVEILTIAYVGGRGTLWGSFAAAALLVGAQEYFRELGAYRLVIIGLLLIIVIMFVPKGIGGFVKNKLW